MTPPPLNDYYNLLWRRTHDKDLDAIIAHVGSRGSCKSGNAIRTGYVVDRDEDNRLRFFLPDELVPKELRSYLLAHHWRLPRIVFKPSDFMQILADRDLPKGSVIVWDEVGVEGDARDFATEKNKILKRVMETVRSKNLVIILTAPTLKSFDIGFQRSLTYVVNCLGRVQVSPDNRRYVGKAKMYSIINWPNGDFFMPSLYFDRGGVSLNKFYFSKPPLFLEKPYKALKLLFQTKLYNEYLRDFQKLAAEDEVNPIKTAYEKVKLNFADYFNFKKNKVIVSKIMLDFNLRNADAKSVQELLEGDLSKGAV